MEFKGNKTPATNPCGHFIRIYRNQASDYIFNWVNAWFSFG